MFGKSRPGLWSYCRLVRLNGYLRTDVYEDDTPVRVSVRRTEDTAYPSGWRYTLHYEALTSPYTENG